MFNGDRFSRLALRRVNRIKALKSRGMPGSKPLWSGAMPGDFSAAALAENAHAVQKTTSCYAQKI
jgi:hypothetical protein